MKSRFPYSCYPFSKTVSSLKVPSQILFKNFIEAYCYLTQKMLLIEQRLKSTVLHALESPTWDEQHKLMVQCKEQLWWNAAYK